MRVSACVCTYAHAHINIYMLQILGPSVCVCVHANAHINIHTVANTLPYQAAAQCATSRATAARGPSVCA